ncbi:LysR family transcriptional regulator [Methylibium petroleiphilum]|uniref:LysR family transcriptional regulator n=1 Tax=Methylibium petroleiphilum TaxID=105560 RepID=UPI003D27BED7
MHLDDLQLFIQVARSGSFSAAARQLALTPAAVSSTVKRIEAALQRRLIERSTRTLRLTPEGERFLDTCEALTARWAEGTAALRSDPGAVDGEVQLAAPADTTYQLLSPWLAPWLAAHPGLRLSLHVSDRLHDVRRESVDIAVRYGALPDSGLVARPLCSGPRIAVASPAYLRRRGTPRTPAQLVGHDCLLWMLGGRANRDWRFWRGRHLRGEGELVRVAGVLCGDGSLARHWALQDRGIASKALCDVLDDLEAGRLVQVLPDHRGEEVPVHALLPSRAYLPARVRVVLERLVERFADLQRRMDAWRAPR